jgi:hypothetical protein
MGLDLPPEAVTTLERCTEGWIAGLQLAALALQGGTDASAFVTAFSGTHRYVLDYLSDEVLARQPTPVQEFLLHTAILERLSGSLCDAVTGQAGSQALLEGLERANLFVVPLDDERGWYRYHHLFAEVLRSHLRQREPTLVPQLHQRASAWYKQHDLPAEVEPFTEREREVLRLLVDGVDGGGKSAGRVPHCEAKPMRNANGYNKLNARARATAWVRLSTPSLPKMLLRCFLTVPTETISASAIC